MYKFTEKQKNYLKRKYYFDGLLALFGLIITSPILLIVAIAIKLEDGGPVLFKQERIGLRGKVFKIFKFRSMCQNAETMGTGVYSEAGDSRVTKVGSRLSTKEQKNLKRNGNAAFCGVIFLPVYRFCPYYGYQHV